ncbi:MAG: putative lipoprotein [Caulobacteraceae bacterium]|nr:putative lipoprotein [Caulobacteraceae bacterium]
MVLRALMFVLLVATLPLAIAAPATADPPPFDLVGPTLDVTVTRAGKTLPIAEAPNLAEGDQLWVKPDFPAGQSAHYVLVVAFLRGATDPPPESWFFRLETWRPKAGAGLKITVPKGAQQALLFLAPETGGDFKTLVKGVRGRPGAFVRASQDLNQASLDRARLEAYLSEVHKTSLSDPERLKTVAPLLARSLAIKLDSPCLQKPAAQQASCLTQGQESLVLSDEHNPSIAQTLTTGSMADLVQQLTFAPQAGAGAYSPYVGAVMDIVRIFDSVHTAQYQYLPALATRQGDNVSIFLNSPPSFHNPKSVLVTALPAVGPPLPPLLQPTEPGAAYCADQTPLVLPADGAPLVFATAYAHDLVLRLQASDGKTLDLPLKADPEKGGFVADTSGFDPSRFGEAVEGSVRGAWGFDPYVGPTFHMQSARDEPWRIADDDRQALIGGRGGEVRLHAPGAACVEDVMLRQASGETAKADWKAIHPDELVVTTPAGETPSGSLTLLVKSFGRAQAQAVALRTFAEPSRLDRFTVHEGDPFGVLEGSRLDEVDGLTLRGVDYRPDPFAKPQDGGELPLFATRGRPDDRLTEGATDRARVALKDGRLLEVGASVAAPRPRVTLIAKSVKAEPSGPASRIQLTDRDAVARNQVLTFSIRSQSPASFSGHEAVQVETPRGAFTTTLTLSNGLTLEDSQVAIATLDTGRAFGSSAAGRLRYRIVEDGVAGDWQPLATLVRLPTLEALKCPADRERPCKLIGADLFLLDALSNDPAFEHVVRIPDGFPGSVVTVPHPTDGRLFVKLRDDPSAVDTVTFPVKASASTPGDAPKTQAAARSTENDASRAAARIVAPFSR